VDVWDVPRVTLAGLRLQVRPVGETAEVRLTVPVKPLTAVTVIVEVPIWPALTETLTGLAPIAMSWTVNVTVAERESDPIVPVTVTV
jgi:hypothetical protein